jgi:hypothetical protein
MNRHGTGNLAEFQAKPSGVQDIPFFSFARDWL